MSDGSFPDALILAALQRAELHQHHDEPGVSYSSVVAHLGLPMGSGTGRKLRPRFRELEAAGIIAPAKRHGRVIYTATPKGQRILRDAGVVTLPESPQHRYWRETRARAEGSIGGFREHVSLLFDEAAALLADDATDSEAWFVLGERLGRRANVWARQRTVCVSGWSRATTPRTLTTARAAGGAAGGAAPGIGRPSWGDVIGGRVSHSFACK